MFDFNPSLIFWMKAIAIIVSVSAFSAIIYLVMRIQQILHWRNIKEIAEFLKMEQLPREMRNERWEVVKKRLASPNPAEWKLAVIEADAIMDDLLKKMNYQGQTMGERLKSIEPSDFQALEEIWYAHKARNRIAHGSEYVLTHDEAERIISLFEKGLKEFEYI